MDFSTTYLGMNLKNPLVASASPLTIEYDDVRKLEDAGIGAVVTHSLFEEQINHEEHALDAFLAQGEGTSAEALDYFPEPEEYKDIDGNDYLEKLRKIKESVDIPVIASLNGVSAGGWMQYARKLEQAGADAVELNIYYIPTNPNLTGDAVEEMYINDLKAVKSEVRIPVSMKLSPYFSSFANMAQRLDAAGADGLVLFNRFYQPDIDLENLELAPSIELSTRNELRLPLRWIAILRSHLNCSLAATSGIHNHLDVLKAMMVGANVAMMTSVLLEKGPKEVSRILEDLEAWMTKHEYTSIKQMQGSMSYKNVKEPAAYERANYMKTLQSYR